MPCGGELRSTVVIQERGGRTTVLNEPGPALASGEWAAYERAIAERLGAHRVLVCSGSVPPGSPPDAYGRLAALARAARACARVVDAAGETLLRALAAAPGLVPPEPRRGRGRARARERRPGGAERGRTPGRARSPRPRRSCGRARGRRW